MVDVRPAPVTTRQRFACFDGYRAIAATAIVVFHVSFIANVALRHPVAGQFLARLDVGVSLFFVISGFLLYRPFVAANLAGRPGPATLGFWRRRLLRIVPAYWAALVVIVYVLGLKRIVGVGDALVYFGFMQIYDNRHLAGGISQAWSLCTEMSFYLVLPLYAWLVRRKSGGIGREVRAVAAVYAAGLFVRALLAYGRLGGTGVYDCRLDWLPATMDLFALGMGLAVASAWQQQGGRAPGWLTWLGDRPWACWSGALAAYVVVATVVFDGGDLGQPFTPGQVMGREVLYGLVAVLLVVPGIFGSDEHAARSANSSAADRWSSPASSPTASTSPTTPRSMPTCRTATWWCSHPARPGPRWPLPPLPAPRSGRCCCTASSSDRRWRSRPGLILPVLPRSCLSCLGPVLPRGDPA